MRSLIVRVGSRLILGLVAASWLGSAMADPPRHAKAHGWRKKHDPAYPGYQGRRTWSQDYGIVSLGRCNTDAVLGVAGAAIGGVVGARASQDNPDSTERAIAVVVGSAIGAVVGSRIGRRIDNTDRACMGHALELAAVGHAVRWDNGGMHYELSPVKDLAGSCREFQLKVSGDQVRHNGRHIACTQGNGSWSFKQ